MRHFSMMKFDGKHKVFKKFRHATNNFVSINKMLVNQHQKCMSLHGFGYRDNICYGVWKIINKELILELLYNANLLIFGEEAYETKYLHVNDYKYSKGIFIVKRDTFNEIMHIVCIKEIHYFICVGHIVKQIDSFLNSFEIERQNDCNFKIIRFDDLAYRRSHEIRTIGNQNYIILDSLDLKTHKGR